MLVYVEGQDLNSGKVDVIVCDGFVGNVALKISEGLWETISNILKGEAKDNIRAKVAYFLMKRAMRRLEKRMDYSEIWRGTPFRDQWQLRYQPRRFEWKGDHECHPFSCQFWQRTG